MVMLRHSNKQFADLMQIIKDSGTKRKGCVCMSVSTTMQRCSVAVSGRDKLRPK